MMATDQITITYDADALAHVRSLASKGYDAARSADAFARELEIRLRAKGITAKIVKVNTFKNAWTCRGPIDGDTVTAQATVEALANSNARLRVDEFTEREWRTASRRPISDYEATHGTERE